MIKKIREMKFQVFRKSELIKELTIGRAYRIENFYVTNVWNINHIDNYKRNHFKIFIYKTHTFKTLNN